MIKQELIESAFWKNGLIKTYSDKGFYIIDKDGVKYESAIDPKDFMDERVYTESDEKISKSSKPTDIDIPNLNINDVLK